MLTTKGIVLVASHMEIRYPVNMSVLSVYGDFQKKYQSDYPQLKYGEGNLALSTVKEHGEPSSVYTSPVNTGFTSNGIEEDKAVFINRANEMIKFTFDKLGLNEFERLGVRLNYILPSESLSEDTKEILAKMLSRNALKQVGDKIGGFEFTIQAETADFNYGLTLGFVKRATPEETLPEQGLLADIDCFKESISVDDSLKYIETVQRISLQKVTDIMNNFLVRRDR